MKRQDDGRSSADASLSSSLVSPFAPPSATTVPAELGRHSDDGSCRDLNRTCVALGVNRWFSAESNDRRDVCKRGVLSEEEMVAAALSGDHGFDDPGPT